MKKNRYQNTQPFRPDNNESVFAGFRPRAIATAQGVLEHEVKDWDRLDLLAMHYYSDASKWWRILDANPQIECGADLHIRAGDQSLAGSVILIPGDSR
ncbi:hypothetical protein [Bacterioplanoides sp.]|uniref:hypothetical protein n=1 Tax=Bacterioplanoides sp. TaxID=2066072 RepID=UPI003AFFB0B1